MLPAVTVMSQAPAPEYCVASVAIVTSSASPLSTPLVTAVRSGFTSPYTLVCGFAVTETDACVISAVSPAGWMRM